MSAITIVRESTVTLHKTNASDIDVARAAWVSQDAEAHRKEKEEGRVAGLIDFLWRNGHTSPFEHGQFTFIVETPIFVAREFMRHRTFSYNEISGRYTVLPSKFYCPDVTTRPLQQSGKVGSYTFDEGTYAQQREVEGAIWLSSQRAHDAYQKMLDAGVAKEVARMVLPVNTMTAFWATVNPLNLMRFLNLRTAGDAQYEIREVANKMEEHFARVMPLTHATWKKYA